MRVESSNFPPVAIVGRGCVLPGALEPAALGALSTEGREVIAPVPAGRWGVADPRILAPKASGRRDSTWSNRGGYVRDFAARFDASTFDERRQVAGSGALDILDPVFSWLLYAGRAALTDAGLSEGGARIGAVVGNLSFPTAGMSAFAEATWLERAGVAVDGRAVDARNRFMSGLPVHLMASLLGLGGDAFCLDAACASSLYAIKLACDRLHEGRADAMVAGAVNAVDDLFLHVGFGALQALSPSGQSRPFHRGADGLLPAEGAALVVLERLEDAIAHGRTIHGVIRGIGLSNDGRGKGFLAPSRAGQVRAMRAAYVQSGIDPSDVSWVECHATGTRVGDGTEIASLQDVFGERKDRLAIGSLKANLGHLITASGAAGLLRVLESMQHGILPPTPNADQLHEGLSDTPFDVLSAAQPWVDDRRVAAVSAFGFGGNNAHLIVEAWDGAATGAPARASAAGGDVRAQPIAAQPIAIVGIGARVATRSSVAAFRDALFSDVSDLRSGAPGLQGAAGYADEVVVPLAAARFPPRDLEQTLPQQLALLAACDEALSAMQIEKLAPDRVGVLVGMQCDTTVARHGARWRVAEWGAMAGTSEAWVEAARDGCAPLLGSAGVLGCMPNICANRINSHYDFCGPSFTVSSEELSGIRALELAMAELATGALDIAIVGAADMSAEPAHAAAAEAMWGARAPGDAAVVLVLERLEDARTNGHPVLALLGRTNEEDSHDEQRGRDVLDWDPGPVERRFGHAHAASGLVQVAAAAVCCVEGRLPDDPSAAISSIAVLEVSVDALGGQHGRVSVRSVPVADRGRLEAQAPPTGPSHVAPAHLPPLTLPSPLATATESLGRAPVLAPVADLADHVHASPVTKKRNPPSAEVAALEATRPVAPVSADTNAAAAGSLGSRASSSAPHHLAEQLLAQRQRDLDVHRAYLAEQEAAHALFVSQQQRMWRAVLGEVPPTSTQSRSAQLSPPQLSQSSRAELTAVQGIPVASAWLEPSAVVERAPTEHQEARQTLAPHGPTFSKDDLRVHAAGKISQIFGKEFAQQDGFTVQVRMPRGKLLLADRVTGIDATPGELGEGTVWTETDVHADSWFLHHGRMPAGLMIEAGQADLFIISYMGIDWFNRGERAYRLLGCEVTYRRSLPQPGETLRYDIHIDGHAQQGDVRLFFFHYDCRIGDEIVLSVRNGQAGFFDDAALAESDGVLWRPEDQAVAADARLDPPRVACLHSRFDAQQVASFAAGDLFGCFGAGFERGQSHTRTPSIHGDAMCFIDSIDAFDSRGGPWGRGYLRARTAIRPDRWYFDGHFENDPCMPGTLMLEGCLQMMAFYIAALGYTLERDGWRFEPLDGHSSQLRCRGQVLPTSRELVCEIFVEEVHDGPEPIIYADLLGTVDGLKAFHARRMALRLVPDWPMPDVAPSASGSPATRGEASPVASNDARSAIEVDGFAFSYDSLMACALGRPSRAFGPMYERFDGTRRVARLPGPPYHFMDHVHDIDGPIGGMKTGTTISIDYDVPLDAWYFGANPSGAMPFAVLLEAVLQPCGWLASYIGSALTTDHDLAFRNLDGRGVIHVAVLPGAGSLRTRTTVTQIAQTGGMIIESFELTCHLGDTLVYELATVFGFFAQEALQDQVGLPTTDAQRASLELLPTGGDPAGIDLSDRPARLFDGPLRLPSAPLLMLDRVRAIDLAGGAAGLGAAVGEKDVDPAEWFFKAHFFQDPVQPGSLGIEAMLQLLQAFMITADMHVDIEDPRFEPVRLGSEMSWKYRGQVVPENRQIATTLEITERSRDERGAYAVATASLWVDGKRIYEAEGLGMRIVSGR